LQPPFDPSTGYYTQVYRPAADGDGRFSPLLVHGATAKYGGNTNQTGQSTQEVCKLKLQFNVNPLVLPNTGVTTQAGGVMQATVPVTQQPIPVFRQPAGVHMSPYPPNYVPYGHYISPFYVPTPTIHHFFGNTALSQQPLPGSIYPPPAAVTTTPVKYSLSQYKGGNNSGNSNHSVMPTGYGPYSSSPTGYGPSPTVSSGNSTVNEDHTVSQYKENNVYMTGQQNSLSPGESGGTDVHDVGFRLHDYLKSLCGKSEGSPVWLPAPGREIPSVQAGSFYNLPQGQQVTFTSQAGNGAFAGIYHPTQAVGAATVHPLLQPSQTMAGAVEMVGAAAGVYQQPQRAQINWPNNY
ncbi:hypothetical protein Taro_021739, partial [Colocasia esculenta]|nr:hypothetical protein [Colocasia esculenta]